MPKRKRPSNEGPGMVALSGSERKPNIKATEIGLTSPETLLDVTVRVRPREELPAIPEHGEVPRMTHQQWEAKHGADPSDIKKVEEYATASGLKVETTSVAERRVLLSGSVSAFNKAFNVELRDYDINGLRFRGRSGPVYIPKSLDGIVAGVFGLSDEPFAEPHFLRTAPIPHATATTASGFTPIDVARHYNFPANLDGTGQTIGIIELGGGFRQRELNTYFNELGVSPPDVKVFDFVGGGTNNPGTDPLDPANPDVEVLLDIEVAGAVAPGAQIVVYFAPSAEDQSFLDVLTAAVHDSENNPTIISISWGGPESTATSQFQQNFDEVLQAAAHLGITVCVASGDNASADFPLNDPQRPWDGNAHVDFPASSPFALACGGTRIVGRGASANEVVWHPGPNEGTGGGVSRAFPLPNYQANVGVPNVKNPPGHVGRGVPDVAGDAAQESGYRILCDGQAFPDPSQGLPPIGGTSAVAPLWAGLLALINQGLGRKIGFINPVLYQLLPTSAALEDITSGNNGDYQAGPGWDPCTGLGVPNGELLLEALRNGAPAPARALHAALRADKETVSEGAHSRIAILMEYFQTTRALIDLLASTDPQANGTLLRCGKPGEPGRPGRRSAD
jgi:kumamolisin